MKGDGRKRILVLGGDPLVETLVTQAAGADAHVVTAATEAAAVRLLSAQGSRFDLVVATSVGAQKATTVQFVWTAFDGWPWVPVVVIAHRGATRRFTAEMLLGGARAVLRWPATGGRLAALLASIGGRTRVCPPASRAKVLQALTALGEDVAETPRLAQLAARLGVSPSHLSRTFHAMMGLPLREYVRWLKLRRAHALLRATDLSLTAIAVQVGFYDLPHFDKAFRQRAGISPREFRGSPRRSRGPRNPRPRSAR